MPDLLEARDCHGSVAVGKKLYVIGGINFQNSELFYF